MEKDCHTFFNHGINVDIYILYLLPIFTEKYVILKEIQEGTNVQDK